MRIKCFSVRLKSLVRISDKACIAEAYDGSKDIMPISQIYGYDSDVRKSDAFWISEWILSKKSIQYSHKKQAWFDKDKKIMLATYSVEKHKPEKIKCVENNLIDKLKTEDYGSSEN